MTYKKLNKLLIENMFNSQIKGAIVRKTDDKYSDKISYIYKPFPSNEKDNRDIIMCIPNRFHQKYVDIEEVEDYDLTSNLVLEMLCRNKIFKKFLRPYLKYNNLTNKIELTKTEKSIEKKYSKLKGWYSEYLGFNMNYFDYLCLKRRGIYSNNFSNYKYEVDSFPRLCDINNGLERAIRYYHKNKAIIHFSLNNDEIVLNNVLRDYSSYSFVLDKNIVNIDENLPISYFDKNFRESISERDLINKVEKIKIGSIFTDLDFIGSKIVNVDLNMNLPIEELIAYVTKIKSEYSKSKTILEIFKDKIENISNPKSLELIPKNNQKKKKAYADAFYIYDLFECIDKDFFKMRKDIKNEYIENKLRIKADTRDNEERKLKIENETKNYKIEINCYNKEKIYDVIHDITQIEINKIKKLHKLLKEYIEDLKYKNIIFNKK